MAIMAYVFAMEHVEQGLAQIEDAMRLAAAANGYIVDENGHVIGKQADSAEDRPDAQHTEKWCDPGELIDGRWYVASYRDYLSAEMTVARHDGSSKAIPIWKFIDDQITVPCDYIDITDLLPEPEDPYAED